MADYDVGAVALVTPAKSAPKTTYRPAVSVRNNGLHDALASGYLRIYSAGLLVFESEVYSATIPAGATGLAQAVDYWTPTAEGFYTIHAYASCPLDQIERNNILSPVTIEITSATPPTPPVVTAHAAQHEEGGTDELSIDGLQGRAADPQSPLDHAAQHQAGGSDALNVGSLQGVLADDQPAQVHSNTRHNPVMTTAAELTAHSGSVAAHTAATNLANRDLSGPNAGLVTQTQIAALTEYPPNTRQALLSGRSWGYPKHASTGKNQPKITVVQSSGPTKILFHDPISNWISDDMQLILDCHLFITAPLLTPSFVGLYLYFGSTLLCYNGVDIPGNGTFMIAVQAAILGAQTARVTGFLDMHMAGSQPIFSTVLDVDNPLRTPGESELAITAEITSTDPNFKVESYSGYIRALHPIP